MQNTRLKNVIFTAGMAIFTGVLLLGVNAAIGVSTPAVEPSDAVGVSPTFAGVVITGISDLQGNLSNSAGNVSVSDNLAVTGNVTATGSVSAVGNLGANGNVNVEGNANISGNAVVTGTSNLQGNVYDSTGAFTIADGLKVTGQIEVNNDIVHGTPGEVVTVNGPFEATDLVNIGNNVMIQNDADITVTGDADIQGTIKNTATVDSPLALGIPQPVIVDDNLSVTGNINTSGITGGAYWEPFPIYYPQIISLLRVAYGSTGSGNTGEIWVQDDVTDTPTQGGPVLELTPTEINNRKGSIRLQKWNNRDVIIGNDASTTSNLTVNGNVLAERFGTVTIRSTARTNVNNNNNISLNQACNSDEKLLSCGANTFNSNFTWDYNKNFVIKAVFPWTNDTCYGRARNESGSAKRFSVYAVCLDPDL